MAETRASWGSLRPLGLAVAVLLAAGGTWGQTTWTKYENNPVLERGAPGEWDDGIVDISTVYFDGTTYHLWYGGGRDPWWEDAIGYATSPDGVTWTKYAGNPVLEAGEAGAWDAGVMQPGPILWDGATFHLWYVGGPSLDAFGHQTGYATSPDGVTWTKHPANPVLTLGAPGSPDEVVAGIWSVLAEGGTFRAWYNACRTVCAIGYATSTDGVNWSKRAEPVLEPRGSGWDGTYTAYPSVAFDGSLYRMWYGGHGSSTSGVGHAVSADGIHWARQPAQEPVLGEGGAGAFDESLIIAPRVLLLGGTAHMWYLGLSADDIWSLGYASAPLPFPAPSLLNGYRFSVDTMWWTSQGGFGYGDFYPLTDDSGAFTFFDPANVEILVKVLDGCAVNQRYWVFAAGLTNVGVTLTVTDTETGQQKTYTNTLGEAFAPIQDTDAFALCE